MQFFKDKKGRFGYAFTESEFGSSIKTAPCGGLCSSFHLQKSILIAPVDPDPKTGMICATNARKDEATLWQKLDYGVYRGSWKDSPEESVYGNLLCRVCGSEVEDIAFIRQWRVENLDFCKGNCEAEYNGDYDEDNWED